MLKAIVYTFFFTLSFMSTAQTQNNEDTCIIYIPNVISIDGDCYDCDKIRIGTDCEFKKFEFLLYDRWGNKVFDTQDPAFEYDPYELKEGTYFYSIKGKTKNNNPRSQTGYITLVK